MASAAEHRLYWGTALVVLASDFTTKLTAEASLPRSMGRPVFGEWFQLRLVYNPGAAFGLDVGPYSRWIFFAVAVLAIAVLFRMSRATPAGEYFRQLALGLVSGGAAGNLVDRIRSSQGVVDFLDLGIGTLRWPTFNVADIAVSCGAVALAISLWREDARAAEPEADSQSAPVA